MNVLKSHREGKNETTACLCNGTKARSDFEMIGIWYTIGNSHMFVTT